MLTTILSVGLGVLGAAVIVAIGLAGLAWWLLRSGPQGGR